MMKIPSSAKKTALLGACLLAIVPVFASDIKTDEAIDRLCGLFDHPWLINKIRIPSRWQLPHEVLPGLPPYNQQVANAQFIATQPPPPTPKPTVTTFKPVQINKPITGRSSPGPTVKP